MERITKMRVLEGLEELKYMALYSVSMYNKTNDGHYRYMLELIVEKAMKCYGLAGVNEVLDFIKKETEENRLQLNSVQCNIKKKMLKERKKKIMKA